MSYDPHPDLAKRVDDIRISLPAGGGLVALLGQLRGAEIALAFGEAQPTSCADAC